MVTPCRLFEYVMPFRLPQAVCFSVLQSLTNKFKLSVRYTGKTAGRRWGGAAKGDLTRARQAAACLRLGKRVLRRCVCPLIRLCFSCLRSRDGPWITLHALQLVSRHHAGGGSSAYGQSFPCQAIPKASCAYILMRTRDQAGTADANCKYISLHEASAVLPESGVTMSRRRPGRWWREPGGFRAPDAVCGTRGGAHPRCWAAWCAAAGGPGAHCAAHQPPGSCTAALLHATAIGC